MIRYRLAASVAALALASPVLAIGPGGGHGGGGDHGGGGQSGDDHRGQMTAVPGGGDHDNKSGERGGERGNRGSEAKRDHGEGDRRPMYAQQRGDDHRGRAERDDRDHRQLRTVDRVDRHDRDRFALDRGARAVNIAAARRGFEPRYDNLHSRGLIGGCPPGLADKANGCLPPGQARKRVGAALPAMFGTRMLDGPYRDWYRDNDRNYYRMGDGYMYQVNRSTHLVDALIPYGLTDYGYYSVGDVYPADYNYYNVPYQYRSYYPDGGDTRYRYGNGAIYQVNRGSGVIDRIVSLLAGDLAVGQRLPSDYGVYNVPMDYRDRYADTSTDWYRYNDGNIYRVDPMSRLITAVISAIT